MPLDHSTADVTIHIDGLGLICFNNRRECELGILKHPHHALSLNILKITPQDIVPVNHSLDLNENIIIEVVDNPKLGAIRFEPGDFSRMENNDPEDFRWTVNLEGDEFHRGKIKKLPAGGGRTVDIAPRIRITDGIFYTRLRSQAIFDLVDWAKDPRQPRIVREDIRIVDFIGADIHLHQERGHVNLKNEGNSANSIPLQKGAGTRYVISISNVSEGHVHSTIGSDFRIFYDVLDVSQTGASRVKFDFREADLGPPPQNCDFAFMGLTNGLCDLE